MSTAKRVVFDSARYEELKRILLDRKSELSSEVKDKLHGIRVNKVNEILDSGEENNANIQEDIEFAIMQMKAETLDKINAALSRLEEGCYGYCFECGGEIDRQRLRALPFAVRCKDCEETREMAERRERIQARRFRDFFDHGFSKR